jgi:hypothetical protein
MRREKVDELLEGAPGDERGDETGGGENRERDADARQDGDDVGLLAGGEGALDI